MKNKLWLSAGLLELVALVVLALSSPAPTRAQAQQGVEGPVFAADFAHYTGRVAVGAASGVTGSYTITMVSGFAVNTKGIAFLPYSIATPITIGVGSVQETVTPTAVSGCGINTAVPSTCQITATFTYTHGAGTPVYTGDYGLEEAIQFLQSAGGQVIVDAAFTGMGGTDATIAAAQPYELVTISDLRHADPLYWRPAQANNTNLAAPTTLDANATCTAGTTTVCSDANAVGTWTSTAEYLCIAYVDIMGNEGPCSTTQNFTATASKAIDFTAPAATAGAVGYVMYSGTSYAAATQLPVTASNCILTKVETVTPACAIVNTTYGQAANPCTTSQFGAGCYNAQIPTIAVTTSPLALQVSTISTAGGPYVGNTNTSTSYLYAPTARAGLNGVLGTSWAFPIGAAAGSTVPAVIGTVAIPPGYMNFVGKAIEVCGYAKEAANGSTSTVTTIQVYWDAYGSDTATGVPILIATIPVTNTLVTNDTDQYDFCIDLRTTVAGASATAGTMIQDGGHFCEQYTASSVATLPKCVLNQGGAAVGSLNLSGIGGGTTRLQIVYLHSTGTDANGVQLQHLTVKDIS